MAVHLVTSPPSPRPRGEGWGGGLALLLASAILVAAAEPAERWTLARVGAWLAEASGGLIGVAPGASELAYVKSPRDPDHFLPAEPRPPTADQDAFTFDAAGFTARMGADDFVSAKRRYYAALPWDDRRQKHTLPYTTPSAWTTLNHPPIKHLDGPPEAWTHALAGPYPDEDPGWTHLFFDPGFQRRLDANGSALTHGNDVRFLANGASFREKLRLIADARDHLYVAVMFWACDESANALGDAMAERVRAGVDVRVITERLYRETITRRCLDRLERGGVKVLGQWDGAGGSVLHWKAWIRDGEELIIGGQNVGNYENHSDGYNFLDRDADVLARGPVVTDAERAWLRSWREHGGSGGTDDAWDALAIAEERQREDRVRGPNAYGEWLGDPAERMHGNCRVMFQRAGALEHPIGPVVEAYYRESRDLVVFSSPTLRYDHDAPGNRGKGDLAAHYLMQGLAHGASASRRVIVLTNGVGGGTGEMSTWLRNHRDMAQVSGQQWLFGLARQFGELVARRGAIATRAVTLPLADNPGLEVWTYFQYLHEKMWQFDRVATMVGSWNLDLNSTDLNPEAAILCLDDGLRREVEADFRNVLVNAVPDQSR